MSIIVNCRDGAPYLRRCLDSAYSQTHHDWEIVFWDDRSKDATPEIAKSYGARLRYFRSDDDVPLGTNRQRAASQARGEFLAFLDADDVWEPSKLERQVSLLRDFPDLGLVYTDAHYIDRGGRELGLHSARCQPKVGFVLDDLFLANFLVTSSVMLRREAFVQSGGFRPHLPVAAEDMDLFLRVAERWPLGYVDAVLTRYRVLRTSWSRGSELRKRAILQTLHDCLSRNPSLTSRLGPRVLRYRLSGLNCAPDERRVLTGNLGRPPGSRLGWRSWAVVPRTLLRYFLGLLGPRAVDRFYGAWSEISPRRLLRNADPPANTR